MEKKILSLVVALIIVLVATVGLVIYSQTAEDFRLHCQNLAIMKRNRNTVVLMSCFISSGVFGRQKSTLT